jgi:acyl-CoA synthetase (AMP-forming)/AMP-acid ligase II
VSARAISGSRARQLNQPSGLDHSGALVPDLIAAPALRFPDKPAVRYRDQTLVFSELSERASRLAGLLRGRGIADGDRVALLAMNDLEYPEIRIGVQRAGAILVPLNHRLTENELASILDDADPSLLIVGRGLQSRAERADVPSVLQLGGNYDGELGGADPIDVPVGYDPESICHISYTSGTTARPKGVMLSNRSIHAGTMAMGHEIGAASDAVFLVCAPLFHVGSQVPFSCLYLGATLVLMPKFDVQEFVDTMEATAATHCQLVPTMIQMALDASTGGGHRLRRILYGAAPMPPSLLRRAIDAWGCEFVNGYGSTESMGMSFLTPSEHDAENRPELLSTVGRSSTLARCRIVDENDDDVATGEIGEVLGAGPALMSGYWRNPEATEEALRGGWMHTGDLGYRDDRGYLHLVDRRHDKIVTGGENVFPTEVEEVILTHPAVAEVAVIGVPDTTWGEAVAAVVVVRDGAATDGPMIIAHCRQHLAGYKVPKQVVFHVVPLPRTATGKLLRRELRTNWTPAS